MFVAKIYDKYFYLFLDDLYVVFITFLCVWFKTNDINSRKCRGLFVSAITDVI